MSCKYDELLTNVKASYLKLTYEQQIQVARQLSHEKDEAVWDAIYHEMDNSDISKGDAKINFVDETLVVKFNASPPNSVSIELDEDDLNSLALIMKKWFGV